MGPCTPKTQHKTTPEPDGIKPANLPFVFARDLTILLWKQGSLQSYFQTLKSIEEVCESHAFQHIALAQRSRGRSDVSARLALVLALSKFTIVCLRRPAMRLSVKSGLVVNVTNKRIKQHKWTVRCRLDILKHIRSCV